MKNANKEKIGQNDEKANKAVTAMYCYSVQLLFAIFLITWKNRMGSLKH